MKQFEEPRRHFLCKCSDPYNPTSREREVARERERGGKWDAGKCTTKTHTTRRPNKWEKCPKWILAMGEGQQRLHSGMQIAEKCAYFREERKGRVAYNIINVLTLLHFLRELLLCRCSYTCFLYTCYNTCLRQLQLHLHKVPLCPPGGTLRSALFAPFVFICPCART